MHLEQTSIAGSPVEARVRSPDVRLVARVLSGDVEAERRFVGEQYPTIYRYLLRLTGSREAAEDLTQETFVEAWRGLETYEGRSSLRVWLTRIAHRQFLHALRSRRPETSLEELGPDQEPSVADASSAVELRESLRALPIETREIVVLYYLEGYTCNEISEIVGVPPGTVKYRLAEARARLRSELGGEGPAPEGRRGR